MFPLEKGFGETCFPVPNCSAKRLFFYPQISVRNRFCLHSLPGAEDFYHALQMVKVEALDKDHLVYFELPTAHAEKLMEVA